MQALMPDGRRLSESFDSMEELLTRKGQLEKEGGKVERVLRVHQGSNAMAPLPPSNPKYPHPHQGSKEAARRRRQIERRQLKASS